MRCGQIMKFSVKCVSEQDPIHHAAALMRDENIGFVPVCSADGKVVGVVTDRDIVIRAAADRGSLDAPISTVMTRDLVTCGANDSLSVAEERMRNRRKSRILCVDEQGKAVGVISLSDLARNDRAGRIGRMLRDVTAREARS